jgi:hypothetical protein
MKVIFAHLVLSKIFIKSVAITFVYLFFTKNNGSIFVLELIR